MTSFKNQKSKTSLKLATATLITVLCFLTVMYQIKSLLELINIDSLKNNLKDNLYFYMDKSLSGFLINFENYLATLLTGMFALFSIGLIMMVLVSLYNLFLNPNKIKLIKFTIILSIIIVTNAGIYIFWNSKDSIVNLQQYIETMSKSEIPMIQYKKVTLTSSNSGYRISPNITPFPNEAVPNNQFIPIHVENTDNKVTLVSSNFKNKKNLDYSFNPYFLADAGNYIKIEGRQSQSISAYAIDLPIIPLNKIVSLQNAYQLSVKTPTTLKIETTQLDLENATIEIIQNNKKTTLFENEQPTSFDSSAIKTKQITITDNSPIYFNVKSNKPIKVKITSIPSK